MVFSMQDEHLYIGGSFLSTEMEMVLRDFVAIKVKHIPQGNPPIQQGSYAMLNSVCTVALPNKFCVIFVMLSRHGP